MSESSANGSVSGSESRIVTGCSHDSNCAASTRYMKMSESTKADEEGRGGAVQLARLAAEAGRVVRRRCPSSARRRRASAAAPPPATCRAARFAMTRHLPLPLQPADVARAPRRRAKLATLSSVTLPSRVRGHRQSAQIAASDVAVAASRAHVHLVLLAALVVGRHLRRRRRAAAAHRRVGDRHAEIGRLRPVDATPTAPACRRSSDVSASTTPGILLSLGEQRSL